jgi:hypothetical protein
VVQDLIGSLLAVRPCIVCGLLVAIVVRGPMFMFTLIFGVDMTVGAMNFMSWLFPLRRGRSQMHRNSQEVFLFTETARHATKIES